MNSNNQERTVFNLQEYGISRGLSFGHYRYNEVKPGLKKHQHPKALEICFCMKGKQHYSLKGNVFALNGNDIFIVPPDTIHSTGEYPEDKGELFWIQIIVDPKYGRICNLPEDQANYLLSTLHQNSELIFKGAFQLKYLLEKLVVQLDSFDAMLSKIMVNQIISQILLETVILSKQPQETTPSAKLNMLDTFIQQHMHRIIYVDEMANLIGVTTGYFKAWFKSKTGMPPKEYVNRLKIEHAKIDLIKCKSVTKVAFDLGFSSSQYFATTFKKFTGTTPRSYINSQNNLSNNTNH
ncbi:AraC family transcriptional regulator [Aurantibacter crassamenti]|uniref:AraC family transcriptional regulator n=1 Tax=Aurantibacter crassamenti TaxID=1837375 RepID=UPI001939EA19|nr:helix-turn-helix domain-containing protein [Aurantibacter crassamenti]MBM1106034.1 AraC family transcriptional regulator [Aurantibacter crassamenti]